MIQTCWFQKKSESIFQTQNEQVYGRAAVMVSVRHLHDKAGEITAISSHTKQNGNSLKPQFSDIFIAGNKKQVVHVKSLSSAEIH
jgi:hypothetical protein